MQTAYSYIVRDTYKLRYWNYLEEDTRKYGMYSCDKIIGQIIRDFKRIHRVYDTKVNKLKTVGDIIDYYHNKVLLERVNRMNRQLIEQANKKMTIRMAVRKEIK